MRTTSLAHTDVCARTRQWDLEVPLPTLPYGSRLSATFSGCSSFPSTVAGGTWSKEPKPSRKNAEPGLPRNGWQKLATEPFEVRHLRCFDILLLRCFRPLTVSARTCRCGRPLDVLGNRHAACGTAGVLGVVAGSWRTSQHVKPEDVFDSTSLCETWTSMNSTSSMDAGWKCSRWLAAMERRAACH